jgi:hypothetical protein
LDYCITVRKQSGAVFGNDPGQTTFLVVPDGQNTYAPADAVTQAVWTRQVLSILDASKTRDASGVYRSDLLVFIHGYNNQPPAILQRQRQLQADLGKNDFKGLVVSFDWPSGDTALSYLPDREHAKQTAMLLVKDCIELFVRTLSTTDCQVNAHILAHSMGAFVVREAFDDSDDRQVTASVNWTASQIAIIAGDVSAISMSQGNPEAESVYRHCVRLTNYSNPFDEVLQLSNAKRIGLAPRVGRVGLPTDAPSTAVNVDCGNYYQEMIKTRDTTTIIGNPSHSWYIGDPVWSKDLAETLAGNLDRHAIATRKPLPTGQFELVNPQTPTPAAPIGPVAVATVAPRP